VSRDEEREGEEKWRRLLGITSYPGKMEGEGEPIRWPRWNLRASSYRSRHLLFLGWPLPAKSGAGHLPRISELLDVTARCSVCRGVTTAIVVPSIGRNPLRNPSHW